MKPFWNKFSDIVSPKLNFLEGKNNVESTEYLCSNFNINEKYEKMIKLDLESKERACKSIVTKKIRIYPNAAQLELFLKCFEAHRYIYNKALEHFNNTNDSNFLRLHRAVIVNDSCLESHETWLKDVPVDTRVQAVRFLRKNIKIAYSNLAAGNIKRFEMKFLSKQRNNDIFSVNKIAVSYTTKYRKKGLRIFHNRLKKDSKLKISRKSRRWLDTTEGIFNSNSNLLHFASITRKKDGSWYLLIPYDKTPKETETIAIDDLVALDPGVRTFQTFYSENSYGKLGVDFVTKRLKPLNTKVDKLTSAVTKVKKGVGRNATKKLCKKKYNLRKRCNKIRAKVSNTVLDLHRKTANFLTNHYKVILIPSFETQKMVAKKSKIISKTTSRNMNQLSHYAFRQRLIDLSKREKRCEVIVCTEEFTSKTCGKCGKINRTLGSSKVFKCPNTLCNFTLDRDVNGARNIIIKYITELCNDRVGTPTEITFED